MTDTSTRELTADDESRWTAFAADAIVAHGRPGAILAFRLVDEPETDPIYGTVHFNSLRAADFALRTMANKELLRRLSLARQAAAGVQ